MNKDLSVIVGGTVESIAGSERGWHALSVRCTGGELVDVLLSKQAYAVIPEPVCPICGIADLEVDTTGLMEDHGENWELVLPTLGNAEIPYSCSVCGEVGVLEDFQLVAAEAGGDAP